MDCFQRDKRACNAHGRDEKCMQTFNRKSEEKRQLGRSKRGWEDNIKICVKEIGSADVN